MQHEYLGLTKSWRGKLLPDAVSIWKWLLPSLPAQDGETQSPGCIRVYCEAERDDAKYTFFECERWAEQKMRLETEVGCITPDNVVEIMLNSEDQWERIASYLEKILRRNKREINLEKYQV